MLSKIKCSNCGFENERNQSHCSVDGVSLGFPNVNILSDVYFQHSLNNQYIKIKNSNRSKSRQQNIKKFENIINDKTQAVINLKCDELFAMINENRNYLPYQQAVKEQTKRIKQFDSDRQRCIVESSFYGLVGGNLIYAALSIDDNGLSSYGDSTIILNNDTIKLRTTVFIKNSFNLFGELIEKGWKVTEMPPAGFYGTWNDKSKIALIKYDSYIDSIDLTKVSSLILKNAKKQQDDEFIELHIYNSINILNFKKIVFPLKVLSAFDKIQMSILEEKLIKSKVELIIK